MKSDAALREELIFELTIGHAHMPFEEAVKDFPEKSMNVVFTNGDYTFWHLLEHIRRTQNDILEFSINPDYKEKEWPKDYWPARNQLSPEATAGGPGKNEKATRKDWEKTVKGFLKDRDALIELVKDPKNDLYKKFPHGTGQTLLREINVIVDHNAYHLGEFAIMRQVLGAWNKGHK